MSDTPETDAAQRWFPMAANVGGHVVDADFARKLEIQRNEARGWAEVAWTKSDRAEKMLRIAAAKADEWREVAERLAVALKGLKFFCEEDQAFASKPYAATYRHADVVIAEFERLKEDK